VTLLTEETGEVTTSPQRAVPGPEAVPPVG
jgi:hypothetical protein